MRSPSVPHKLNPANRQTKKKKTHKLWYTHFLQINVREQRRKIKYTNIFENKFRWKFFAYIIFLHTQYGWFWSGDDLSFRQVRRYSICVHYNTRTYMKYMQLTHHRTLARLFQGLYSSFWSHNSICMRISCLARNMNTSCKYLRIFHLSFFFSPLNHNHRRRVVAIALLL